MSSSSDPELKDTAQAQTVEPTIVDSHIVEIVSDSGEGAQTAGQMFGTVSAKMGNSVWTVESLTSSQWIKEYLRSMLSV